MDLFTSLSISIDAPENPESAVENRGQDIYWLNMDKSFVSAEDHKEDGVNYVEEVFDGPAQHNPAILSVQQVSVELVDR